MSLAGLLRDQDGVVTRVQLRQFGLSRGQVRAQLDAGRWRSLNEVVVCAHNGPLSSSQQRWAAVLSAQGLVALCGLTALTCLGVTGFDTPVVHVMIRRGARVVPIPDVDIAVHESRRFDATDVLPRLPPVTGLERATIDAAVWSGDITTATRMICAPIQQRRSSAVKLREELTAAGQVKFRGALLPFIADLEGGAEALSEVAFLRWCRTHGFPKPATQVRLDSHGRRRYLDATFETCDGSRLLAEIDGGIHLNLATRWNDTAKDNDAVIDGEKTLRFPSIAIYSNDPRAVAQLRRALEPVRCSGGYGARKR